MLISFEQAKELFEKELDARRAELGCDLSLWPNDGVWENIRGWHFSYDTRKYIETGERLFALAPPELIVIHRSGKVHREFLRRDYF